MVRPNKNSDAAKNTDQVKKQNQEKQKQKIFSINDISDAKYSGVQKKVNSINTERKILLYDC